MRVFYGLRGHRTQESKRSEADPTLQVLLVTTKIASLFVKNCSDCHLCPVSVSVPFTQNFLKGILEM